MTGGPSPTKDLITVPPRHHNNKPGYSKPTRCSPSAPEPYPHVLTLNAREQAGLSSAVTRVGVAGFEPTASSSRTTPPGRLRELAALDLLKSAVHSVEVA